jgi:glycerol-3-phosphate O-acyltransferase
MEELLRHGEFMEIFIEGQRTRSGKAVYPKGGLLSVIVDSLMTGMHSTKLDNMFLTMLMLVFVMHSECVSIWH